MTDNGEKRDALGNIGETLDTLRDAQRKKKRDRTWEREQRTDTELCQVAYRGIPRSVRDRIKGIAQTHQVTADKIARLLLEYALEQYSAGRVEINVKTAEIDLVAVPKTFKRTDSGTDSG